MMILGILLFGATLYSSQATSSSEQVFFMDITAPQTGHEYATTILSTLSNLKNTTGITLKQSFKVVGEPRILAVVSVTKVCSMRTLELQLESLKLVITTKELYDTMDLATDLALPSNLIALAKSKRNETLAGEHIYFAKSNLITKGDLNKDAFTTVLRTNIQKSLGLQIAGLKFVNYNVLGEFPMQMVNFAALAPRELQKTVWNEDRKDIFIAPSMARVVQLEDYIKEQYCG